MKHLEAQATVAVAEMGRMPCTTFVDRFGGMTLYLLIEQNKVAIDVDDNVTVGPDCPGYEE